MIYLSFERNNYEFTIFLANLFWNYYVSREFTMNSSSVREFTMISIFVSWFDYKFIFFFANSLSILVFPWIHNLSREFTMNSLFFAISLWSSSYFAFCVWIHYQFLDLTINALFVRFITMDSLAITLYDYELKNGSAEYTMNSLSFCEFTMNSLSFSRILYKNTIFFVIWLQYLFYWSTMYFQFFSLTFYWSIIVFANSLWIHYLFRKFTIKSQDF